MTSGLLGAHVPTSGGLALAPARGNAIRADAIQIFTRSQLQWKARSVAPEEAAAFREATAASGLRAVVAHGSYLVNLASPEPRALERSREAFVAELERCHALGIGCLIFHPGAHLGAGEAAGLATVAASLVHVLERTEGVEVSLALEATAGMGSSLGHSFEQLAAILELVKGAARVRVCLDTCHLFAAGYDIASPAGYESTLRAFERTVGLARLAALHLNDSRRELGSRADRHAPIGAGHLGLATFRRIVRDARLRGLPMLLETPGGLPAWKRELALLRRLRTRGARPAAARPRSRRRASRP
jgi:deoxyribonuclease-4